MDGKGAERGGYGLVEVIIFKTKCGAGRVAGLKIPNRNSKKLNFSD